MTRVAILPERTDSGVAYRAIAGDRQSTGKTAGQAVDALTSQLPDEESGTLVVVQNLRADCFFDENQRRRLEDLMTQWRSARDAGLALPAKEQAELEALVDAEVDAAGERAGELLSELGR